MMTRTYKIPVEDLERVQKAVARIEKKAAKYGCEFRVEYGKFDAVKRSLYVTDEFGCTAEYDTEMVEVMDVTITSEIVRKGNYQVIAALDHTESGNVVKPFTDLYRPEWAHVPGICEHCGVNHHRLHTFIVSGDDGEHQVGKSCLMDYCGIDPQSIGISNEVEDIFLDEDMQERFRHAPVVYNTVNTLALAIQVIRDQGYVRSGDVGANRDVLANKAGDRPADSLVAEAKEMAVGIMAAGDADNILHNVSVLLRCGYCKLNDMGYIAYAPLAYKRYLEKQEREAARKAGHEAEIKASEYVGAVGERMVVDLADMKLLTSWEGEYGITHLYKMVTVQGNVLIWFSSSCFDTDTRRMKVTVKDHNLRDGVRQTVVYRCKAC